jgi:hypothetical protein
VLGKQEFRKERKDPMKENSRNCYEKRPRALLFDNFFGNLRSKKSRRKRPREASKEIWEVKVYLELKALSQSRDLNL